MSRSLFTTTSCHRLKQVLRVRNEKKNTGPPMARSAKAGIALLEHSQTKRKKEIKHGRSRLSAGLETNSQVQTSTASTLLLHRQCYRQHAMRTRSTYMPSPTYKYSYVSKPVQRHWLADVNVGLLIDSHARAPSRRRPRRRCFSSLGRRGRGHRCGQR